MVSREFPSRFPDATPGRLIGQNQETDCSTLIGWLDQVTE